MTQSPNDSSLFGPDVEAALASAPFAPLAASGAPIIVAAGDPAKVVGATESALALFAADSLDALAERVFGGSEPGARRLAELSRVLLPGAAPRLERLRFFFGPVAEQVTMLCQRVPGAQAPLFVMALLGVRPNLLRPPQPKASPALRLVGAAPEPGMSAAKSGEVAPAVAQEQAEPIASARLSFEAAREALRARFPAAAPIRFLWRTDADDRIVEIAPPLPEITGARDGELVGETFANVAARLGLDPDGRLTQALAARGTWSGLERLWPLAHADAAVPVVLGALPSFDAARKFEGYRGFGVIHVGRLTPHQPTPVEAEDDAVAESFGPETEEPVAAEVAAVALHESDLVEPPVAPEAPAKTEPAPRSVALEEGDPLEAFGPEGDAEPAAVLDGEATFESELAEPAAEQPVAAETPPPATEAPAARAPHNVVQLRLTPPAPAPLPVAEAPAAPRKSPTIQLTPSERNAFREIARALGAQLDDPAPAPAVAKLSAAAESTKTEATKTEETPPNPAGHARDLLALASRAVSDLPAAPASSAPTHQDKAASASQVFSPAHEPLLPLAPTKRAVTVPVSVAHPAPVEVAVEPLNAPEAEPIPAPVAALTPLPLATLPALTAPAAPAPVVEAPAPVAAAHEPAAPAPAAELPAFIAGPQGSARVLLEKLPLGVLVSRDGTPIFANRALLDLLGYANEDEFHDLGGLERMFKGRQPDQFGQDAGGAVPLLTRGGDVISAETHMQTLDWGGLPATMMSVRPSKEADLLPRVRSLEMEQRALDAEARELRAILDTATDGVAVLDPAGRILSLNRSAEALFGYDQNEVAGEPFTVLIAKESQSAASDYLDGLKSNGVASVLNDGREVVGRARQGGAIPMFMTLGRIGACETAKFCAVLRDLSQWKKAERDLNDARAQAERASALKSDFLAKISHEIRTPLNAILGFAEVIMEERFGPVGNDRYKDYLKDIHASGAHVMSLVNDLLDLSKIEAGKMDLTFGSVDANRIVSECVSLMQPQAARERVIMRLSLAPRLPNVVVDERSLRQIVLNLLSNAVKFNEPGGQVIVSSALTDAGHAVIRIRDTGIGMSEEEVVTALEPFRQIATSRQTSGTGLGLPLTKALVEANRASFTIKSKKREGTLVEIAFPPTRVLVE